MPLLARNVKLLERAKELRRNMTKHERHLWYDFLRDFPEKFYRQRIIGNYIADFYCSSLALVIELDGMQHKEREAVIYDAERSAYFNSLGLTVLRFDNYEIDKNFNNVCLKIKNFAREKLLSRPCKGRCHEVTEGCKRP